jgi:hypothetical protein
MSSPEFAELRGVSGTAVAARAAIVDDPAIRRLLWFLQARSLEPGGLKQVAREILERHAARIGTPAMHKFGMKPGQIYKAEQVRAVRNDLGGGYGYPLRGEVWSHSIYDRCYCDAAEQLAMAESEFAREQAKKGLAESQKHPTGYPVEKLLEACQHTPEDLTAFLTDLCINPRLMFQKPGERPKERSNYEQRLESEFPTQRLEVKCAELFWFQDIIGALLDYQRREEEAAQAAFVLTAIGRKVWETLDFALKSRRMVLVEGWEGRGKSEAAKLWCRMHPGEARFVSLKGVSNKTTVFREIARALGIACSYKRKSTEMQARIEDVLQRSRLMLVFDEAHFFFNQSARVYTRPELIDWVDTALENQGVPVALITTPQFIQCVKRAQDQVGWNWRQFRRRVARWVELAQWNTDADLAAVARKIMPGITGAGVKLAMSYAKLSFHGSPSRDISGLGDVAIEARLIAEQAGRATITFEDVERAINDHLMPSDTAFASRMAAPVKRARKPPANPLNDPLTPHSRPVLEGAGAARQPENFTSRRPGIVTDLDLAEPLHAGRALVPA